MSREMKDSGVGWLGEIPKGWNVKKGKALYSITTGKLDANAEEPTGIYPFFTCSMFPKKINQYAFDCEALLVAGNGVVGFTQYYKGKFNAYQRTYVLSDFHNIYPLFLKYYVSNNLKKEVEQSSVGSVIQFIKLADLQNFNIALPEYKEQEKIADYLEMKCQKLDHIIEKTKNSIEEYKKFKQSITMKAVTQGISNEQVLKDSGVAWLGNIPESWKIYRIANLYQERSESGLEELPILTVSINSGVSDREIADEEKDRVFVRSEDRTKYKRVYPGDLVYNMMRAWQGAFGAVRVEGMISPAYVVAKPKDGIEIDSRYMEALLRTPEATEEMHRYSRGIIDFRLRLYWPEFKNIRICLPPIEEQKEIADFIDRKSQEIDLLLNKKEQFISELENYKKSLIYEYVTGKREVPEL